MGETEQASRIILAFGMGILIVFLTAKLIGEERKARWFKKRKRVTIFTRRGLLGEACHFGVPCKWQGVLVSLTMFGVIGLIGYFLVFKG
ncbi:hypothetical protein SDC9_154018 [bioreactor metagenome]|jgi:hypothetical protein|uniref:Uncharacterized protein n=1 Tax=bioreactor metagenome TaxID=1076179 RepID=A0A645EXM1_9ZZZZ